jgi:hypothetical protein
MREDPDRVRAVAPRQIAHWRDLALPAYIGGPFADRSGGLIVFDCASLAEAREIATGDPFVVEGLVRESWLREWLPE